MRARMRACSTVLRARALQVRHTAAGSPQRLCAMFSTGRKRCAHMRCRGTDWDPAASAGAISHGDRQYMHLKVDTFHIILWKSK